jgi:hypothetical protein
MELIKGKHAMDLISVFGKLVIVVIGIIVLAVAAALMFYPARQNLLAFNIPRGGIVGCVWE